MASHSTEHRCGQHAAADEKRWLREAFSRFATGVTVITTRRDAHNWAAITVNSFTSVSLDPPLLLFGLALTSNSRATFEHCERFAVSILRHDQQRISTNFARPSSSCWVDVPVVHKGTEDLVIGEALATFRCRRVSNTLAGDHVLLLGEIMDFAHRSDARPLVFFQGAYGSFSLDQAATLPPAHDTAGAGEFTLGWG